MRYPNMIWDIPVLMTYLDISRDIPKLNKNRWDIQEIGRNNWSVVIT